MGVIHWTPACIAIGILNLLVFSIQAYGLFNFQDFYFYTKDTQWYQYFTSILIHADWEHLTSNAFFLFAFGGVLEKQIKTWAFVVVYVISGVGGNIAFQIFSPGDIPLVGASGAIFGIICSMAFFDPKAFVISPGAPLPVPILAFIAFYMYNEYAQLDTTGGEAAAGQISHLAHLGGGVLGAVIGKLIVLGRGGLSSPTEEKT